MIREGLIDLAAARVGGRAISASDEFFAPKENLLEPGRGIFIEGRYTDRGKWMDGWETRRRRGPGGGDHDWCIIRLGIPGVIRAITVDTNHFRGNHPAACSVDAAELRGAPTAQRRAWRQGGAWAEILARSPLTGHAENEFSIQTDGRFTHVRLNIYPDGGVARLRVWGEARPDWRRIATARRRSPIDLVALEHGGLPLATSDQFFSEPLNLLMPGRPRDMGDGWETRRRRGPGHDWVVLRLGRRGVIDRVELDTTHFKGNFPESASLEGYDAPQLAGVTLPPEDASWCDLVPRTKLRANARHRLPLARAARGPVTHVRLNIFPDGGVARLRLWGRPADPT